MKLTFLYRLIGSALCGGLLGFFDFKISNYSYWVILISFILIQDRIYAIFESKSTMVQKHEHF